MAVYFVWRVVFLLAYQPPQSTFSVSELVIAFLIGLRFDNAIFFILNALPLLLLFLPIKQRWYATGVDVLLHLTFIYAVISLLSGFVYFGIAQKHPTIELRLIFSDFREVFFMALKSYWYVLLSYVAIVFLGWKLWRWLFKPLPATLSWRNSLVCVPLLLLITVISIRGGLQSRPLRPSMAFQNENMFLGNLALNSVYTSVTALFHKDRLPVPRRLSDELITGVWRRLLANNEKPLSAEYPLWRTSQGNGDKKLNVVVFIMESWSAADVGALGGRGDVTPYFDRIAAEGLLFTEAYATNTRSIESLPSIISSIPSVYGITYITSNFQTNSQRGLWAIYAALGYNTYFAYAAWPGSMGFDSYARQVGFRHIITRDSFPSGTPQDGTWGIYDEITFLKMHELFAAETKPFAAVIYSLHPHPPYGLPEGRLKINHPKRSAFYTAMRYSDDALAAFFERAKQASYFKDTIFVITADHAFEQRPGRDSFRVPLLFYAPAHIKPGRQNRVASQLDILPSLMQLTKTGQPYSAAGKSLFDNTAAFSIFQKDSLMGYIEGDYALLADGEKPVALFNRHSDPEFTKNLISAEPSALKLLADNYFSYISVVNSAIMKDRFAPPNW